MRGLSTTYGRLSLRKRRPGTGLDDLRFNRVRFCANNGCGLTMTILFCPDAIWGGQIA